jgi:hypothetical protein
MNPRSHLTSVGRLLSDAAIAPLVSLLLNTLAREKDHALLLDRRSLAPAEEDALAAPQFALSRIVVAC